MGSNHLGPNWPILQALKNESGIDTFIETGTWKGGTSKQASSLFEYVITIEGMPGRWWKTWNNTLCSLPNVASLTGDTVSVLPFLLHAIEVPAIFWLDAHYCTTNQEERSQGLTTCPVLKEIEAINNHRFAPWHVILVDDARLFGVEEGWPLVDDLLPALQQHGRQTWIHEDIWYAVQPALEPILDRLAI